MASAAPWPEISAVRSFFKLWRKRTNKKNLPDMTKKWCMSLKSDSRPKKWRMTEIIGALAGCMNEWKKIASNFASKKKIITILYSLLCHFIFTILTTSLLYYSILITYTQNLKNTCTIICSWKFTRVWLLWHHVNVTWKKIARLQGRCDARLNKYDALRTIAQHLLSSHT